MLVCIDLSLFWQAINVAMIGTLEILKADFIGGSAGILEIETKIRAIQFDHFAKLRSSQSSDLTASYLPTFFWVG